MAKYAVNSESLTAVADAIRAKTGGTDLLAFPDGMVEAIGGISGGGGGGSTFVTSATGCIPDYDHGYATTELTDVFTTSATGKAE